MRSTAVLLGRKKLPSLELVIRDSYLHVNGQSCDRPRRDQATDKQNTIFVLLRKHKHHTQQSDRRENSTIVSKFISSTCFDNARSHEETFTGRYAQREIGRSRFHGECLMFMTVVLFDFSDHSCVTTQFAYISFVVTFICIALYCRTSTARTRTSPRVAI